MDSGVSDSLGGVFPNKVYATLEIRACKHNYQCTPARKINSIDSRVHVTGRFMLKPDPTTTNYILYLLVSSFASSQGCRGRELGGMINMYTTYYYTMLQQLLLHFYLYYFIELLVDSSHMLQDSSEDSSPQ